MSLRALPLASRTTPLSIPFAIPCGGMPQPSGEQRRKHLPVLCPEHGPSTFSGDWLVVLIGIRSKGAEAVRGRIACAQVLGPWRSLLLWCVRLSCRHRHAHALCEAAGPMRFGDRSCCGARRGGCCEQSSVGLVVRGCRPGWMAWTVPQPVDHGGSRRSTPAVPLRSPRRRRPPGEPPVARHLHTLACWLSSRWCWSGFRWWSSPRSARPAVAVTVLRSVGVGCWFDRRAARTWQRWPPCSWWS